MIHDKFNMVDMGGIDVLDSQGEVVQGLYSKLVESITLCRYSCLYNWKFNGIVISPTYVELDIKADGVWINDYIVVTEDDTIHIYSIEPDPPVINPIDIVSNGIYNVPDGVDGFNPVSVQVPPPVLVPGRAVANGEYFPEQGADGFGSFLVEVPITPAINPILGGGTFTASTSYIGFEPYLAVGNGARSFWGSAGPSNWWKCDLGDQFHIASIKFSPAYAEGSNHWWTGSVTIEGSNDDATWDTIGSMTGLADSSDQVEFINQSNNEYRYYRINCTGGGTRWCGLGKIQFYL
jgi:hypothetical protein